MLPQPGTTHRGPALSEVGASPDGSFLTPTARLRRGWTGRAVAGRPASTWPATGAPSARPSSPCSSAATTPSPGQSSSRPKAVTTGSRLDNMIAANAATGKKTAFGITTYNGRIEGGIVVPAWLINGYPQTTIDCGSGWKIPRYWNSVYQTKYRNFVTGAGQPLQEQRPRRLGADRRRPLRRDPAVNDDRDDGCIDRPP